MSDIEELYIGRHLILSQKSDTESCTSTATSFRNSEYVNKPFKNGQIRILEIAKKILFRHCANALTKSKVGLG